MKKKWLIIIGAVVLTVVLTAVAFAANPIKLIVNGQEIKPDVPPQLISGRTMVPIRCVSEALGADVQWDGQNNTILISKTETSQQEIDLISSYLRQAKGPEQFVQNFAGALQKRNGAIARLFLSPDIRSQIKPEVIGTSTPIREVKVIEQPMIENNTFRYTLQAFYTPYGKKPAALLAFEIGLDVAPERYDLDRYFITKLELQIFILVRPKYPKTLQIK